MIFIPSCLLGGTCQSIVGRGAPGIWWRYFASSPSISQEFHRCYGFRRGFVEGIYHRRGQRTQAVACHAR